MSGFSKSVRKAEHTRRYVIEAAGEGWEMREERDSRIVRQTRYRDWHRVERAVRAVTLELDRLRADGWQEV